MARTFPWTAHSAVRPRGDFASLERQAKLCETETHPPDETIAMTLRVRDPIDQPLNGALPHAADASRPLQSRITGGRSRAWGALALGAIAVGALAVGAVVIGRLVIGRARIRRLDIDELVVRKLHVTDELQVPPKQE